MSVSVRRTEYDLLEGHFDLPSEEAPPYLQKPPPAYKLNPVRRLEHLAPPSSHRPIMGSPSQHVPHGHGLRAIAGELSPGAGPENPRLSGFDLAESIWSQDSDLTLEDLPLDSDSASSPSRSSTSSHWSAPPLTPSTSRHLELQPPPEPAILPEPNSLSVEIPVGEVKPAEPGSPAPAYSRDPLEFDPALLASLEPQLRLSPFEAFEDVCWASCFLDPAPADVTYSLPPRSTSLSHHPSTSCTNITVHSMHSQSSMATMLAPPLLPPLPPHPSLPPPAYPASKPLPSIPPPSPLRTITAEHIRPILPQNPPEDTEVKSSAISEDHSPLSAAASGQPVQFFPLRPPMRPRSKSVGGLRTVRRLTSAISRLRGRE